MEEESIEFLEWHIKHTFGKLCERYVIEDIKWMEQEEDKRAYARLFHSNMVLLFPPFLESD
jgi:hypothetical protein